jgi:Na+-driven multidrug efflux pump
LFPFIVHSGETAYLGRATLLAALVNVALTAVLMQTMGPVGAAVATFVAYLLRLALVWERVARRVALPWPMRRAPQVTS